MKYGGKILRKVVVLIVETNTLTGESYIPVLDSDIPSDA